MTTLIMIAVTGNQISSEELVKVYAPAVTLIAGEYSAIHLSIHVKSGYHIQANNPGNESVIPTTVEMEADKEIVLAKQTFPPAKEFRLTGSNEILEVYDGQFDISILIRAGKKIRRGLHRLDGKLNYQACDSVRCLFPRVAAFSVDVNVR